MSEPVSGGEIAAVSNEIGPRAVRETYPAHDPRREALKARQSTLVDANPSAEDNVDGELRPGHSDGGPMQTATSETAYTMESTEATRSIRCALVGGSVDVSSCMRGSRAGLSLDEQPGACRSDTDAGPNGTVAVVTGQNDAEMCAVFSSGLRNESEGGGQEAQVFCCRKKIRFRDEEETGGGVENTVEVFEYEKEAEWHWSDFLEEGEEGHAPLTAHEMQALLDACVSLC
uniref:Uncharacterized protein n=1 Tax=Chromera velia CCMP2878 TaxID=1169474 RepID=A0A0G4G780_9ALVE|eukprot:Cvel_20595.t1-p1 / transcript=Cvel_20595.t1 / gene=Cvel_20595 / organism=Chromera_velia_CCMP2878 / gene_product=hypothetical protein / transcript_product=hypothetical protein / location=Cvel_scaffold1862:337-1169(-) / protein_length=229 / sequence_SO=supercontig / SO=protein_coding / is_pseudo=false